MMLLGLEQQWARAHREVPKVLRKALLDDVGGCEETFGGADDALCAYSGEVLENEAVDERMLTIFPWRWIFILSYVAKTMEMSPITSVWTMSRVSSYAMAGSAKNRMVEGVLTSPQASLSGSAEAHVGG